MEMARVWPIICQFGFGAVLCTIGIWCGLSSGYLDLTHRDDRRLLVAIWAGYFGLLILACVFTFWLPHLPGKEG